MKKLIYCIQLLLLINSCEIKAQTIVNTYNTNDSIWEKNNSPYYITGQIDVPANHTLKIEPGVKIIFKGNHYFNLSGDIILRGTKSEPIEFTGDSLSPGTFTYWPGITFKKPTSSGFPDNHFNPEYCIFRNGGGTSINGNVKCKYYHCEFYNNASCFNATLYSNEGIDSFINCSFINNLSVFTNYKKSNTTLINCEINSNKCFTYITGKFKEINNCKFTNCGSVNFSVGSLINSYLLDSRCYVVPPMNCNTGLTITIDNAENCVFKNTTNKHINSLRINRTMENCYIEGMKTGVIAYGTSATPALIQSNVFTANKVAIMLKGTNNGANTVACNRLELNDTGLLFSNGQRDIVINNYFGNTLYNAINTSSTAQNLTRNYFYVPAAQTDDFLIDALDFSNLGPINYNIYDSTLQKVIDVVDKDPLILQESDTLLGIDTACISKADDPVIILNTPDTICHKINTPYISIKPDIVSPRYKKTDLSLVVMGTVNNYIIGTYTETYVVTTPHNRKTVKKRVVMVKDSCNPQNGGGTNHIKNYTREKLLQLFPNPSRGIITIDLKKTNDYTEKTAMFYDATGKLLQTHYLGKLISSEINCSMLPDGLYYISINSEISKYTSVLILRH